MYGNEKEVGDGLQEGIFLIIYLIVFKSGIVKREDLWITSKVFNNCHEEYSKLKYYS